MTSAVPTGTILEGDAVEMIQTLPPESIDCVITSPPYFRLRDYQVKGQIGAEGTVEEWVSELRAVAAALHRVLRPSGTFWLNLGDSYSTHQGDGAPRKSMLGAPERVMLALVEDGWTVRNKVVWAKTNPMPTSVRDRLSTTHEVIFLLTKSVKYYFDLDAIRQPHRSRPPKRHDAPRPGKYASGSPWLGANSDGDDGLRRLKARGLVGHAKGKNPGDVWRFATAHYTGAHFATFPPSLVERMMRAGSPKGGIVLDPFMGAGTTAVVAEREQRQWLGIELNPRFIAQSYRRIEEARDTSRKRKEAI